MMSNNNNIVIILAAGKGTRMKSDLPKVLHPINNKPMLINVIEAAEKLNPSKIIIVIGYKKQLVIEALIDKKVVFIEQKKQLGTGDAIKQCLPPLKGFHGNVLILSGDVPLIKTKTLLDFITIHNSNNSNASLISTNLKDPTGYGRIIKNNKNQLEKIVEHKDANKKELMINEINSGIYIFGSDTMKDKIPLINNDNSQNEYYLPDIFNFIDKKDTAIYNIEDYNEISGVNTNSQLKELEKNIN